MRNDSLIISGAAAESIRAWCTGMGVYVCVIRVCTHVYIGPELVIELLNRDTARVIVIFEIPAMKWRRVYRRMMMMMMIQWWLEDAVIENIRFVMYETRQGIWDGWRKDIIGIRSNARCGE